MIEHDHKELLKLRERYLMFMIVELKKRLRKHSRMKGMRSWRVRKPNRKSCNR